MRFIPVLGGAILAAQSALSDPAGDAENGRALARQCQTCHGIDGYAKIPIAPHIGGEPAAYIARQLASFRDGQRSHEMMTVVAASLDDAAINDLAAWYSSRSIKAALPNGVSAADAPDICVSCHGPAGLATIDDAPNLAGETVMYIDTQLKAFRNGKRQHEVMSPIAFELTDADIRAFSKWYGATVFVVLP